MEELIRFIIDRIVDRPGEVKITREGDNIIVTVPKQDMGKIIGKQGRIAKALRTIVRSASKDDAKINLDIVEAE